jgi:O-antigen/teichoic acid export membrane protein
MGLKELLINNRFIKDVLTLFSGSAIAQVIGFAFMPVLTRLFSPEEFGIFYIFLTTASILSLLITGGYEKSLVLPSSDNDARHLLLFAFMLSILATILSLIILFFLDKWGDVFFQTRHSQLILWLIPVYSFLFGVFRILQNWSIRITNRIWLIPDRKLWPGNGKLHKPAIPFMVFDAKGKKKLWENYP